MIHVMRPGEVKILQGKTQEGVPECWLVLWFDGQNFGSVQTESFSDVEAWVERVKEAVASAPLGQEAMAD